MPRCDQCYLDGGIKVGTTTSPVQVASFEIEILGAKMKICDDHRRRLERELKKAKMEMRYHELKKA